MDLNTETFATVLLRWFDQHGRHDLPWQHPRSAYYVWLSEVMLQQTQVVTVKGYFRRFVERFPDITALAAADLDEVLILWAGLGYYSRARNLHACAKQCLAQHGGDLPGELTALMALPGIGRSTAGAILAQAFGQRAPILDGNVKRVLTRLIGVRDWPGTPTIERMLWLEASSRLPETRLADYTQAIMDFGATLCRARTPNCTLCPFVGQCQAKLLGLTELIPAKRVAKIKPTRLVHWLLAIDRQGRVLLERRPDLGIWGGLYSFPEAQDAADFEQLNLPISQLSLRDALPEVRHVFSHFTLKATPIPAFAQPRDGLQDTTSVWLSRDALKQVALPAPVAKLLKGLISEMS